MNRESEEAKKEAAKELAALIAKQVKKGVKKQLAVADKKQKSGDDSHWKMHRSMCGVRDHRLPLTRIDGAAPRRQQAARTHFFNIRNTISK